jgi:Ser/Thr protein kinase RdoA (MazF antagonist)
VHGDFFPGNILVADDEAVAMIDWEEAHVDWVTWDLANALGTFCAVAGDLDRAACRRFIPAYRAGGGIAPEREDDLLVPLIRAKRILEVLRAQTDRCPRWGHQRETSDRLTDSDGTRRCRDDARYGVRRRRGMLAVPVRRQRHAFPLPP